MKATLFRPCSMLDVQLGFNLFCKIIWTKSGSWTYLINESTIWWTYLINESIIWSESWLPMLQLNNQLHVTLYIQSISFMFNAQ